MIRLAFVLATLAPLSAAGTLTVGPVGSGAQFNEIQAAIDAAQDGDVILVAPGSYQRIVADKPLRILGDGTGSPTISADAHGVTVRDIGAGEEFVLSGIEVLNSPQTYTFTSQVLLQDCPGTVILHDAVVQSGEVDTGMMVENCSRVMVLDSQITGGSDTYDGSGCAIQAFSSTVWIANSQIICQAYIDSYSNAASSGIDVFNSTLHVWRTSIVGGDLGGYTDYLSGSHDGGHGIVAARSTVNLFGGANSMLVGGQGSVGCDGFCWGYGGNGLKLNDHAHARVQASLPIQSGWDAFHEYQAAATSVDGTSTITFDPKVFPTLASNARQAPLGAAISLTLAGNPGGYQALYLSLHTGPTEIYGGADGFGLLIPTNLFTLAGDVPASGTFTVRARIPNTSALLGSTLFFQSAERFPNVGYLPPANRFSIGNPVLVTVESPDTTSPVISCPSPLMVLDRTPEGPGEDVSFTVTATDELDPSPVVTYVPPSGSHFPPGTTLVDCTATDWAGNQSTCQFSVTVFGPDTTPPVLSCPSSFDVFDLPRNGPGEHVSFTVTATDDLDPSPVVTCVPPSGSHFPPGTTLVNCTATDWAGNQSTCQFSVTVTRQ